MKNLVFILIIPMLLSCSNEGLPKYYKLDRLRILALTVNTPEVQKSTAAETLTFQIAPFVSDIGGAGNIDLTIQSCLDPGVNIGADPTCEGRPDMASQSATISFADNERTGSTAAPINVSINVPENFLAAYSPTLQHNGVAYLITVQAVRGSDSVKSFRRVLLSTKTPNQNPILSDILGAGASLAALPLSKTNLSFSITGSPESYEFKTTEGDLKALTEVFETTWFVSDGDLEVSRTFINETTEWTPPSAAPIGRSVVVVGVLRDRRGGVSVLIRKF